MTCTNVNTNTKSAELDPFLENRKGSIKERLKMLIGSRTTREVAKDWGIPLSTLSGYLSRGSIPPADKAYLIADKEGRTVEWLVTGTEPSSSQAPSHSNDTVEITKYDIAASAGGGAFIDTEDSSVVTVSQSWLIQNKLSNSNLCIINAKGDSMEPSIHDGDELFLKVIDNTPDKPFDGVYVMNLDRYLKVKRLQYSFVLDGYRVISDNAIYKEEFVARCEIEQRLRVIAEVVRVLGKPTQPATSNQQPATSNQQPVK